MLLWRSDELFNLNIVCLIEFRFLFMNCSSGTKIMRRLREERRSFANHLQLDRFMLIQQTAYVHICVYSHRWSGQGMVMKGWYKHCKRSNNKQQNQYCRLTAVLCCKIEKCWGAEQWSMETTFNTLTFHTQSLFTAAYTPESIWKRVLQVFICGARWSKYHYYCCLYLRTNPICAIDMSL